MDRNLILAIALSALVVIAYQQYLKVYYPESLKPPPPAAAPSVPAAPALSTPSLAEPAPPAPAQRAPVVADVLVDTDLFQAGFSTRGGRLVSFRLKHYRTTIDPESPPLELVSLGPNGEAPLGVTLRGASSWSDGGVTYQPSAKSLAVSGEEKATLVFRAALPEGGAIEKRVQIGGASYVVGLEVQASDPGRRYTEAALAWTHLFVPSESYYSYHGPEALVGGKLRYFDAGELEKGVIVPEPPETAAPVRWAGYTDSYFLSAICPKENDPVRLWVKLANSEVETQILVPISSVAEPGYPFTVYLGPKDLHTLSGAGHNLTRAVDLGWFTFVAEPMLRLLKVFHRMTGNYGFDIILLTVLVKVVLIPLTQKSFRSMQEMQKLQPQLKKLQEKYAEDRAALNKEVMELYRRHKVNPLGGCLPMLVQMPVFIGLYNALMSAVELRHAPFLWWINDLSAPDRLPAIPSPPLAIIAGMEIRIPVLTLLMGASMLVQQRMTPAMGDPMQQRMMMLMPVVFTVMFINFPSGLVVYWLVNNVITIAQQFVMQRASRRA